jgi:hypothetical protein
LPNPEIQPELTAPPQASVPVWRANLTIPMPARRPTAFPQLPDYCRRGYPRIKIHDPRVIRLLEVLLLGGSQVGGWTAKHIHHAVCTTFHHAVCTTFYLADSTYRLNQLRYDLRKLKAHGLLQRDGSCCAYRLTPKGLRSPCSSCSFTNGSAARSPTAAFTTAQTPLTSRRASSKPPTIAPTMLGNC